MKHGTTKLSIAILYVESVPGTNACFEEAFSLEAYEQMVDYVRDNHGFAIEIRSTMATH